MKKSAEMLFALPIFYYGIHFSAKTLSFVCTKKDMAHRIAM